MLVYPGRGGTGQAFFERVGVITIGAKRQPIGHVLPSSRLVTGYSFSLACAELADHRRRTRRRPV